MTEYLDGLMNSLPTVRSPFELGRAAMKTCKWDNAIVLFKVAAKQAAGSELVALASLMGLCHEAPGRWQAAREGHEESIRLAEQYADLQGKAAALTNLGRLCLVTGETDKARKHHEEAMAMAAGLSP
jgi:tetratricopeptide (TPR) repeat protein